MRRDNLGTVAAQGALIVAGSMIGVIVLTLGLLVSPGARAWLGVGGTFEGQSYAVGNTIDVPGEVFSRGPLTLVVFANYTCGACEASVPVLAEVVDDLAKESVSVALVTNETLSDASQAFAQRAGFSVDDVWHLDLADLQVRRVPAIVMVDRTGAIAFSKEGILEPGDRAAIRAAATKARGTL